MCADPGHSGLEIFSDLRRANDSIQRFQNGSFGSCHGFGNSECVEGNFRCTAQQVATSQRAELGPDREVELSVLSHAFCYFLHSAP